MEQPTILVPDDREAKLPRWAQEEFRRLRRAVAAAEQQAEEARLETKPDESPVIIPRFRRGDDIGLGDSTIRFRVLNDHWDKHFDVSTLTGGGITVRAGRGPMFVESVSSNVIRIRQGADRD